MTGLPRIRIEPAQLSLTDFRAALNGSVEVTPDQESMSQRNLILINCTGEGSQLDVRIVRILTLETNGFAGRHSDARNFSDEIPQRETWHWFSRLPDTGSRSPSTARDAPCIGVNRVMAAESSKPAHSFAMAGRRVAFSKAVGIGRFAIGSSKHTTVLSSEVCV
jgi:hypothetical protein